LPQPGVDLTGKTLHAMVRLVSGPFDTGGVQVHASTGGTYVYGAGTFLPPRNPPARTRGPLNLALPSVTSPGFNPAAVVQLGVQIISGFTGDFFFGPVDLVFEIDTFTD